MTIRDSITPVSHATPEIRSRDLRAADLYVDVMLRSSDGGAITTRGSSTIPPGARATLARVLAAFREQSVCYSVADDPASLDALRGLPRLVATPTTIDDSRPQPFVLDGHRLYLHRAWAQECEVAEYVRGTRSRIDVQIVTGGPGSGKTSDVARQLLELVRQSGTQQPAIALTAPTGKAAKRVRQAIERSLTYHNPTPAEQEAILALPAQTVHKLLGANPAGVERQFKYGPDEHLPYTHVFVDEASMMSLDMMHHLMVALPDGAQLTLIGDPDQLASVDSGTVLGDIVKAGAGRLRRRTERYRHRNCPKVMALADAIRDGDADTAIRILSKDSGEVRWVRDPKDVNAISEVCDTVVAHARSIMKEAHAANLVAASSKRMEMQVLCAHRRGAMGVAGWNREIERRLGPDSVGQWYVGRPVIVTVNDRVSGLSNGDVGVLCRVNGERVVSFSAVEPPVSVAVTRLPQHETVHALTIHKSQGSEYAHVVVVLPEGESRILTRELLYTGVTRAFRSLTLIGSEDQITRAINTPVRRATGLAERVSSGPAENPSREHDARSD
jgi:exodeoxyribonuclease V alpha subunit